MEQSPPIGARTRLLLQGGAASFRLSPFEGIVLLTLVAGAFFIAYTAYARVTDLNATPPIPPTYIPAFRTTLTSSVSTTGSIQSTQQVTLTFGASGKIKEFLVGLGAQVTAGQPLARIDDTDLQQTVKSAQSNLDSAQARYNAAVQGPSITDTASALQAVNTAKGQLATAQQNLADLKAKPTASDLATAQQGLLQAQNAVQTANDNLTKANNDAAAAQADLATAQADQNAAYNQLKDLNSTLTSAAGSCPVPAVPSNGSSAQDANPTCSTAPSPATYQSAATNYNSKRASYNASLNTVTQKQTTLTNALNSLNSGNLQRSIQSAQLGLQVAQQKYSDTQAGAKQSELDAAQRSVDSAQASVDSAQAKYDALFEAPKPETILPLQASVDQARAQLETAKQNLAAATIVAPFSGQISQVTGEVGSQVGANTAVFILLNPNLIRIDASVDQSDISNLKAGQTATVTFDALAGRTYQATITNIGLTPTVQQGVVTYVVSFGVDTSRLAQGTPIPAPGMTASLSVLTSRTENALVVPSRGVKRVGRTSTVTVRTPQGNEQKQVTVGSTSGNLTQILAGIDEGDEVLVSLGSAAATTATTANTNNPFGGGFTGGGAVPGGGIQIPITR